MNSLITWKTKAGSIRLLPSRGRVLGIEVNGDEALWSPTAVGAPWNLGGERLWLGPESDWFWKKTDKVDFAQYQVPGALDPDQWTQVTHTADSCSAQISINLSSAHSRNRLHLSIARRFDFLSTVTLCDGIPGLGLCITTSIEIQKGTTGQAVDLWSVLQVPVGGKFLAPTVGVARPRDYFSPCPKEEMEVRPGFFALCVGGSSMFKVGIAPEKSAGRIAYLLPIADQTLALVRSFPVHPALRYCDSPLDQPTTQGDACQFFNDGKQFGNFGELEHHSPALVCGEGPQSYSETTITAVCLLNKVNLDRWKQSFLGIPN